MANIDCLLILLFIVILTADCSLVVQFAINPLEQVKNFTLNDNLPPECEYLLKNPNAFKAEHLEGDDLLENIDPICEDYRKIAYCLRAVRPQFDQGTLIKIDTTIGLLEFLCSDKGKSGIKELQNKTCFQDEPLHQHLRQQLELCNNATVEPNSDNESSTCSNLRAKAECMYTAITEICDEQTAEFFHEMNMIIFRAMPMLRACFPERTVEVIDNRPVLI